LREDLYYRLNVLSVQLPPLRERSDDIAPLVECFVQHYAEKNQKPVDAVDEEALNSLRSHPWPGNVRQLRNVIERAVILCQGKMIQKSDLPDDFRLGGPQEGGYLKIRLGSSLDDIEKEVICRTIEFTGGNKTRAAQLLGVSTKTLYNKLESYEPAR
jgi:DNA-binding NtrC family response regulator